MEEGSSRKIITSIHQLVAPQNKVQQNLKNQANTFMALLWVTAKLRHWSSQVHLWPSPDISVRQAVNNDKSFIVSNPAPPEILNAGRNGQPINLDT